MWNVRAALLVLAACGEVKQAPSVDAPAGDAPAGDAPAGDAPAGDAPLARCQDRPGVMFCDGFEDAGLAAWPDLRGAIVQQTNLKYRGAGALQAMSNLPQDTAAATVRPFGSFTTGDIYLRAWFYVPTGPAVISKVNLLDIYGGPGDGMVVLVDQNRLVVFAAPSATTLTTQLTVPRERWFCVELHVAVADAGGSVRLDVDGIERAAATNIRTRPDPGFSGLSVGTLFLAADQAPLTIYVDELALGTQPHGCS